jgi:hypothetical protein
MQRFRHEQLPDWCYVTIPGNPAGQKVGRVMLGHTGHWPAPAIWRTQA